MWEFFGFLALVGWAIYIVVAILDPDDTPQRMVTDKRRQEIRDYENRRR